MLVVAVETGRIMVKVAWRRDSWEKKKWYKSVIVVLKLDNRCLVVKTKDEFLNLKQFLNYNNTYF